MNALRAPSRAGLSPSALRVRILKAVRRALEADRGLQRKELLSALLVAAKALRGRLTWPMESGEIIMRAVAKLEGGLS